MVNQDKTMSTEHTGDDLVNLNYFEEHSLDK